MAAKKKAAKKVVNKVTDQAVKDKVAKAAKKVPAKKKVTKKGPSSLPSTSTKAVKKTSKKVSKKTGRKTKGGKKVSSANLADNLIHGIEPYAAKAREKYMNPTQVTHFRDILVAWKTNLLDDVSRTIHLMQDENINHPDPNDRASQETDISLELRNRDRERKLLKKIDSTIARVENDDYGWCDRCGIEIGIRRLEARPTAELCVDCKTLNEIKERQMI